MRDRGLINGLLAGAALLLLFSIVLTLFNISHYSGQTLAGGAAVSRPAPPPAPAPVEPAAEPEAPAEEPAAE